jgi:hypothetical protein
MHVASDRLDAAVEDVLRARRRRARRVGPRRREDANGAVRGRSRPRSPRCATSTFPDAPRIRNELLNRRALSSAAAAARRALLDAMLARMRISRTPRHRGNASRVQHVRLAARSGRDPPRARGGAWGFGAPPERDPLAPLRPAWTHIERFLDRTEQGARTFRALFEDLAKPPLGLREGPAAVLVFAVLLSAPEEVALFEDGTYLPEITDAIVERLLVAWITSLWRATASTRDVARWSTRWPRHSAWRAA